MVWEFPAISQSQIEFWGKPQYTRKGLLLFTLFFGAFGLHHLYLRSPQTFLIFLIGNTLSLGYWYWFDLAQIYTNCPDNLNKYGLTTPIKDLAIARGMFICGKSDNEETKPEKDDPPNPLWFMLYSLLLPFPYFSSIVAGDYKAAFAYFISSILPIVGVFILFAVSLYGGFEVLAKPGSVFVNGTSRIFPFTLFGFQANGNSPAIVTKKGEKDTCGPTGFLPVLLNFLSSGFQAFVVAAMPFLQYIVPPPILASLASVTTTAKVATNAAVKVVDLAETKVIPLAEQTLERGMKIAEKGADAAVKVGRLAEEVPKSIASTLGKLPLGGAMGGSIGGVMDSPIDSLKQKGGGMALPQPSEVPESSKTTGDWMAVGLIGAVMAGGFLLTAGRSFKDAVQHIRNPGDTPP